MSLHLPRPAAIVQGGRRDATPRRLCRRCFSSDTLSDSNLARPIFFFFTVAAAQLICRLNLISKRDTMPKAAYHPHKPSKNSRVKLPAPVAEVALKISEQRCSMILENIQDGYYEVDLDGNYTFFNEGLLRITGYSQEEMLGLNNRRIVDEFNNKKVFGVFHQVYLTGVPAHAFDWECIRKDGSRRFVEVSVTLKRDIYGKPAGFMGIARDITERKRYQSELEAKESELRQKNQSLEEANTALNVLMKKMEEHRTACEETLRDNLNKVAMPYLQRAKEKIKDKAAVDHLRLLEESLGSVFAPYPHSLAEEFPRLTSTEIDVANFIVQGRRTKEIADVLNVTPKAIEVHRNNLRRKFGLTNQKTGLRTHLLALR
jgi:PAS domain S-box-containing protein